MEAVHKLLSFLSGNLQMKLASILLCSSLLLLVDVECKPVKRADIPAVTAFEGIDNDKGGFKEGTTYTVTLITDTNSGSGNDLEDFMPKDLYPAPPDFDSKFKEIFGKTPLEFLNSKKSETTSRKPTNTETTSPEPTSAETTSPEEPTGSEATDSEA